MIVVHPTHCRVSFGAHRLAKCSSVPYNLIFWNKSYFHSIPCNSVFLEGSFQSKGTTLIIWGGVSTSFSLTFYLLKFLQGLWWESNNEAKSVLRRMPFLKLRMGAGTCLHIKATDKLGLGLFVKVIWGMAIPVGPQTEKLHKTVFKTLHLGD